MEDRYDLNTRKVSSILGLIQSGDIAVPEIQRPFVWKASQVRDFIDSLYRGYPTGYLITWRNPDVKIKGGGVSAGKTVLIDGQQRVTALMTALVGQPVLDKNYVSKRIVISFNPLIEDDDESPFKVLDASVEKDSRWIQDISGLFVPGFSSYTYTNSYIEKNPDCNSDLAGNHIADLVKIADRPLGYIELKANCDINEVADIFSRVNSKNTPLSQADFVMSKIASDEEHDGSMLRKAIDYHCRLASKPEFWSTISNNDDEYMSSEYARLSEWLKDDKDDIYDPDYNDVLRVAFMSEFGRGKLSDLVALLSGRDFEARDYKSEIADESFEKLRTGVRRFMRQSNFQDFVMALRSAGFNSSKLVRSKNAVDFAYNLYLTLQNDSRIESTELKSWVRRWFVLSLLTGRYSGSSESQMDRDIRQIHERGFIQVYEDIKSAELSDTFWEIGLPQKLDTKSTISGVWLVYVAAQVKFADNTMFTSGYKVSDVVSTTGDVHHIFPKNYLKKTINASDTLYNKVANYTFLERKINIAIGDDAPCEYFSCELEACREGHGHYGDIQSEEALRANLAANCIPEGIFEMTANDYEYFLAERRKLMAAKIRDYFKSL